MTVVHVFTGETLPHDAAAGLAPQVLLYPPARRGDLLRAAGLATWSSSSTATRTTHLGMRRS